MSVISRFKARLGSKFWGSQAFTVAYISHRISWIVQRHILIYLCRGEVTGSLKPPKRSLAAILADAASSLNIRPWAGEEGVISRGSRVPKYTLRCCVVEWEMEAWYTRWRGG